MRKTLIHQLLMKETQAINNTSKRMTLTVCFEVTITNVICMSGTLKSDASIVSLGKHSKKRALQVAGSRAVLVTETRHRLRDTHNISLK